MEKEEKIYKVEDLVLLENQWYKRYQGKSYLVEKVYYGWQVVHNQDNVFESYFTSSVQARKALDHLINNFAGWQAWSRVWVTPEGTFPLIKKDKSWRVRLDPSLQYFKPLKPYYDQLLKISEPAYPTRQNALEALNQTKVWQISEILPAIYPSVKK